jgi:Tol biopolymer transport system component
VVSGTDDGTDCGDGIHPLTPFSASVVQVGDTLTALTPMGTLTGIVAGDQVTLAGTLITGAGWSSITYFLGRVSGGRLEGTAAWTWSTDPSGSPVECEGTAEIVADLRPLDTAVFYATFTGSSEGRASVFASNRDGTDVALLGIMDGDANPALSLSPSGDWVAFGFRTGDPNRWYGLAAAGADGTPGRAIAVGEVEVLAMRWSPKGDAMAYLARLNPEGLPATHELRVVQLSPFSQVTLPGSDTIDPSPGSFSWAPDGTQLAFSAGELADLGQGEQFVGTLRVAAADGTGGRRLAFLRGNGTSPTWSAAGEAIYFDDLLDDGSGLSGRYRFDLPAGPVVYVPGPTVPGAVVEPWGTSSNGMRIAFSAWRQDMTGTWLADVATSDISGANIAWTATGLTWLEGGTWEPGGDRLLYIGSHVTNGPAELFVDDVSAVTHSTAAGPFTPSNGAWGPQWSPVGGWLAFYVGNPQQVSPELFALMPGGGPPQNLTAAGDQFGEAVGLALQASWSPNGLSLAFEGGFEGGEFPTRALFTVPREGGTVTRVAGVVALNNDGTAYWPGWRWEWSTDSQRLVYVDLPGQPDPQPGELAIFSVSAVGGAPARISLGMGPSERLAALAVR